MTTLSKRVTPRQAVVMRMVYGAAINAGHAHPAWKISPKMASSIAKRATGTLTAGWRAVLAAPSPPSEREGVSDGKTALPRCAVTYQPPAKGGASDVLAAPPPLLLLHNAVGVMAGEARRGGQNDRYAALADVLRLIARMRA